MLLPHWGYGIFTQLHPFPPLFTHFVPIFTTSTSFQVDFSPPLGTLRRQGLCSHIDTYSVSPFTAHQNKDSGEMKSMWHVGHLTCDVDV